jgi:hypothetical protein
MQFRLLPAGLEEAQFKRMPEGWLFTTVNPWIFAPRRTYLLSDAQKPAIVARVRRARYLRAAVMFAMMTLMVAAIVMHPALVTMIKTSSLMGMLIIGAFGVLTGATIVACDHLAVRSLLRDLARSSQKIGYADMMRGQSKAMSKTAIAIFAALLTLSAVGQTYFALTSAHTQWVGAMAAMACAVLAAMFFGMLVMKMRARNAGF